MLAGDAAEATYETELCLNDQSLESCLNRVALSALKLADREARREVLGETQAAKIADTMKEIIANLDDFEPRRWFFALSSKKSATEEESQKGLAALAKTAEDEESLPVLQTHELAPGWEADEPILCIGGRSALDEAAAAILAEVAEETRAGRQDTWARSNFRRPHCLTCQHRCQVGLPVSAALGS